MLMGAASAAQVVAPEVAATCDLVANGGFEAGDALPEWWGRHPKEDADGNRHLRDTEEKRAGESSGLLHSVTPHTPGKAGIQWNRYNVPVEDGSAIIASYWIKTTCELAVGAGMHFYAEDGGHLGYVRSDPKKLPREWTHVRNLVRVPEGAVKMGYALYGNDSGDTWFDDVAAISTPNAEAVRGTPKLDGALDEALWADDAAITDFVIHTGEGLPSEQTEAWLAYDDDALYVAFRCEHAAGATLKEDAKRHDGDVWLDDSFEVYLDPHHGHESYFQICVNCRGAIRDSEATDAAWESGAKAKVKRGDDAWTVEIAIPFERLRLGLDVGETWGINLVRNDRVNGQTATWSLGGFHEPTRFGNAALGPDLSRFYRVDLAKRTADLAASLARARAELDEADLPEAVLGDGLAVVDEAGEKIDALAAFTGAASEARKATDDVAATIALVRQTAITSLFRAGGDDGAFRVALASSLQKVRRDGDVVNGMMAREVKLDAARDEAESFQVVVIPSGEALESVTVEAGPLEGPGGELPVAWRRVDYVETADPKYPTEYVGWWPDPLLECESFSVKADERQPIWCSVAVPADATPGVYTGTVTVSHGGDSASVPVTVRVRNFALPRPGTLSTAFGLYASFFSRWWYGQEPYKDNLDIEKYAEWGQWLGENYRLAPKNIGREFISVKVTPDDVEVDLGGLQTTVAPVAEDWWAPYSFCLHRVPTSSAIRDPDGQHTPDDAARVTKAIKDEWERLGLPKNVYIYGYDEPRPGEYAFLQEAYRKIKDVAPEYPIMQTLSDPYPEALAGLVDIWCPLTPAMNSPFYEERREAGDTLWTYVCCGPLPPHANFFIDQPATDHRVLFWQTWKAGATGLLYWGICIWDGLPSVAAGEPHWPDVPARMEDHTTYKTFKVNGDGLLVWPGPNLEPIPSIRLECIRDGIEDYEYLALLGRLVEEAKEMGVATKLVAEAEELLVVPEEISASMTDYTKDAGLVLERRRMVGDMIEVLMEEL